MTTGHSPDMAKKGAPEPPPEPIALLIPREEATSRIGERIELGSQMLQRPVRTTEEYEALSNDHSKWSAFNRELLRRIFSTAEMAEEYSRFYGAVMSMGPRSLGQKLESLQEDIRDGIHRLDSIKDRLELIPLAGGVHARSAEHSRSSTGTTVFVVHGHDDRSRETVARYLERLGLEPIILHEQPSGGRTIMEKLERYADVAFAVVLLTPDDIGAPATPSPQLQPRARQNVILELGFFVGRLGRDRVCALHKGPLELPSDYLGVVYVPLDDGGGWRLQLAKELKQAGFQLDMNRAL